MFMAIIIHRDPRLLPSLSLPTFRICLALMFKRGKGRESSRGGSDVDRISDDVQLMAEWLYANSSWIKRERACEMKRVILFQVWQWLEELKSCWAVAVEAVEELWSLTATHRHSLRSKGFSTPPPSPFPSPSLPITSHPLVYSPLTVTINGRVPYIVASPVSFCTLTDSCVFDGRVHKTIFVVKEECRI